MKPVNLIKHGNIKCIIFNRILLLVKTILMAWNSFENFFVLPNLINFDFPIIFVL